MPSLLSRRMILNSCALSVEVQRTGRFVHDHQRGLVRQRLEDFNGLPLGDGQLVDDVGGLEIEAVAIDHLLGHGVHFLDVDDRQAGEQRFLGQVDVLRHAHAVDQGSVPGR